MANGEVKALERSFSWIIRGALNAITQKTEKKTHRDTHTLDPM